ncbi:MAG: hypothetical protein CM1200mP41_15490 [Gammaproteobacteria bacterium]|nr:MAG: hypothetical protein CM1200mP41_15490 [Gammaproteobacteria bacterium]
MPHMKMAKVTTGRSRGISSGRWRILIVAGYLDQGGKGIIQASLDTGAFDVFYLPEGHDWDSLPAAIGDGLNGSIGDVPGTDSPGAATFKKNGDRSGF